MGDYFQSTNINAGKYYKNGIEIDLSAQGAQGSTGAQGAQGAQGAILRASLWSSIIYGKMERGNRLSPSRLALCNGI